MAVAEEIPGKPDRPKRFSLHRWLMNRVASPGFQAWAARFPLTRRAVRRDGERLFDLVSGFAYTQVLLACVELEVFETLRNGPLSRDALAHRFGLEPERARILLDAAVALDLLSKDRQGRYRLSRLGAATLGVPGLAPMIRHHAVFYRDLEDPVAFLKGDTIPELSEFWPYVRGETAKTIPEDVAATYSNLMAQSQRMVAEETLNSVDFSEFTSLMDVGGGTGAFLTHVAKRHPTLDLTLFDLPPVIAKAEQRDLPKMSFAPGSFHDVIPEGHDAISLIRVLYDHSDETIRNLLARVFEALPSGGTLIVSEPMTGGTKPHKPGDVYFALYTLAMTTGKARSGGEISDFLGKTGFQSIKHYPSARPFVTSCITAKKP